MTDVEQPVVDQNHAFVIDGHVAWVAIGDEVVIHRVVPPTGFVLNATAALLWRCLDGVSPLREVLDDIADAFAVDRAIVDEDCVPVVATWVAIDLVREVDDDGD